MRIKNMQITEQNIVKAAWELLGESGIEEFSMRKLANLLSIQAASLYWHFKSKQVLFQTMANEVARETMLTAERDGDWKEQLYSYAACIRRVLSAYPCSAHLLMSTPPSERDYLALINALLQIIDPLPLSDSDKFSAIGCLLNYVISFELDKYEQNKATAAMSSEGEEDIRVRFRQTLSTLPVDGPNVIQRMYEHNLFREVGSDHAFQVGLQIVVLGIEQLAR